MHGYDEMKAVFDKYSVGGLMTPDQLVDFYRKEQNVLVTTFSPSETPC